MNRRELDSPYYVDPAALEAIVETFTAMPRSNKTFAERSVRIQRMIASSKNVSGAENIPKVGPVIIVKNHPCHYDALLLSEAFAERPELRLLAKPSPTMRRLPAENTLLLEKKGPHGDPNDIKKLQTHLIGDGSLLATPWGSLDHQARGNVTPERAVQNVLRFAEFAGATIVPVSIDAEWNADGQFPLQQVDVTYRQPIEFAATSLYRSTVATVIGDMYQRYTY